MAKTKRERVRSSLSLIGQPKTRREKLIRFLAYDLVKTKKKRVKRFLFVMLQRQGRKRWEHFSPTMWQKYIRRTRERRLLACHEAKTKRERVISQ